MDCSSCTKNSVSIDLFNLPLPLDARRQRTMFCKIPNDFFLPDRNNTQLNHIINTWTFDRLIPNGNEGVGVQINYLECVYGTKYYVVDKVNIKINAIYDDSLELMEFKGHFSPFNLEELEMRVCRLSNQNKDEDDLPEPQLVPQIQDLDSNLGSPSIEDMTGMSFDSNNYSPIPPVGNAASQKSGTALPTSTPRPIGGADFNTLDPTHNRGKAKIIDSFTESQEPPKKSSGKVKSSQENQHKNEPQPSTSSQTPSNGEWRPLVHCSACGGDHLRKDCCSDTFCTKCRSKSHNTDICCVPTKQEKGKICIYCGSKNHSSVKCTNRPNDNREEPRSTPRDLQSQRTGNLGNKSCVPNQNKDSHHQARFDERYNRQYSPNNNNIQPSPLGSIPDPDLSATLIELANIQSRSLKMMAATQRRQQEAFHKLMRASRDKANDTMFANIKSYDGKDRQIFGDWINKIDQACQVSNQKTDRSGKTSSDGL